MTTARGLVIWADDPLEMEPVTETTTTTTSPPTNSQAPSDQSQTESARSASARRGLVLVDVKPCVLGIRVSKGAPAVVHRVEANSILRGKIKVGYRLLKFNSVSCEDKGGDEVMRMLVETKDADSWRLLFQCVTSPPQTRKILGLPVDEHRANCKKIGYDCKTGDLDSLQKHLAKYRIDINEPLNSDKETALHLAVIGKSLECVQYLCEIGEGGLDFLARDSNGNTAYDVAKAKGVTEIEQYLRKFHNKLDRRDSLRWTDLF